MRTPPSSAFEIATAEDEPDPRLLSCPAICSVPFIGVKLTADVGFAQRCEGERSTRNEEKRSSIATPALRTARQLRSAGGRLRFKLLLHRLPFGHRFRHFGHACFVVAQKPSLMKEPTRRR